MSHFACHRHSRSIAAGDRVPLFQKFAFAAGVNMDYMATGLLLTVLWLPYFNIGLGMSPTVLGVILMILRAWDAFTDPIVGNWSDNARTRWGRRRPFIFCGAILTALMYPAFWHMPATLGSFGRALWLTLVGMAFFACYTLWSMSYYSLQLELTPDYDERTRITAWMTFFGKFSLLAGGWVMALATGGLFTDATGRPDIVAGMRICGWVIAGGILLFGFLPALFVRERYYKIETKQLPRVSLFQSLRESARCKPLWSLIGTSFFLIVGYGSVAAIGQYVNIYYVCGGDLARASVITGWKTSVVVLTGIACIPVWTWLGERFDKKTMVAVMLAGCVGGHLLNIVLMTPDHPYWQIIPGVFESGAIAAIWLFLPSMKADIADYDESETARRREGSLNAFYSWFNKVGHTLAMGIGGFIIDVSGFVVNLPAQSPAVLKRMMVLFIATPILCWGLALACVWFYPLSRERMTALRALLENRRGCL